MQRIPARFVISASFVAALIATPVAAQDDQDSDEWAWQNPFMAPNPWSNIHNDSWFTDTYNTPAALGSQRVEGVLVSKVSFQSPITGRMVRRRLATCAAHSYNSDGELVTVCSSWPELLRKQTTWSIVTIGAENQITAYHELKLPYDSLQALFTQFGGIGYFYLDEKERIVLATPEGDVGTWRRTDSPVSDVDGFVAVRNVNVAGAGTPLEGKQLYGLVPNEQGFVWFTTTDGHVGTVAPEPCESDCVRFIDLNDPDGDGVRDPQRDGGMQQISESHSVNGLSTYQQTDYKMYRIDMQPDGTPEVAWQRRYNRGTQIKPGQTSQGSGTSPVYFEIEGREFVTIMDNARRPNINVYRAEKELGPGERRVFAKRAPFGRRTKVSDENSLIVYPGSSDRSIRIYAENNWGNSSLASTIGPLVTRAGFGGIEVWKSGRVRTLRPNKRIRVPNVVSKGNIPDNAIYTYNKRVDGWYITALDADDLSNVIWTAKVGPGRVIWNSWYAQLSQAPDQKSFWVANLHLTPVPGEPPPDICFSLRDPADFIDVITEIGEFEGGEIFYPAWLKAFVFGSAFSFAELVGEFSDRRVLGSLIADLGHDLWRVIWILWKAGFDANNIPDRAKSAIRNIAGSHGALLEALEERHASLCAVRSN